MRVLLSTLPGLGHLHPMIPLGRALADAGHEVKVAASPSFGSYVERSGLESLSVGPDWMEEDIDLFCPGFTSSLAKGQMTSFVDIPRRGVVEDIPKLAPLWRPDVILHDHTELGGWMAGELLDVPHVPFAMTSRLLDPDMMKLLVGTEIPGLLEHFGLPQILT